MPGAGLPLWFWVLVALGGLALTILLLVALGRVVRVQTEIARALPTQPAPRGDGEDAAPKRSSEEGAQGIEGA